MVTVCAPTAADRSGEGGREPAGCADDGEVAQGGGVGAEHGDPHEGLHNR